MKNLISLFQTIKVNILSKILAPLAISYGFLAFSQNLQANNLQIDHVSLQGQNTAQQYTMVTFDLSWENSWRLDVGPANWDAAWVFVKFRVNNGPWEHASLNYVKGDAVSDGHHAPPGSAITTPQDAKGVFIYRDAVGSGDVNYEEVQLRWNYGLDGVNNNAIVEVQVFAIEMVYVPEGSYRLGGVGGDEVGRFYTRVGLLQNEPYGVVSENEIEVAVTNGALYYNSPPNEHAGDQLGPIPAQFPKGYQAFYCMKYEVTQEQWIAFFNTLKPNQQVNNDLTDLDHKGPNTIDRNSIDWEGTGGASTEHPHVPVSFPLWGEVLAYMDWAALRPMTELEFVKACRGPETSVPNGYAWGTSHRVASSYTYDLVNKGTDNELILNHVSGTGNANTINSSIFEDGPYRSGIFAASALVPDREGSGATYYGIMEMTGNLSEMCVTVGTPQGRAYRGRHGDGVLDKDGEADVNFWPPKNGNGGGLFGGSWFSLVECLWINDRRSATVGNVGYFNDVGFRCVRTAP